jgi:hypothetical protein
MSRPSAAPPVTARLPPSLPRPTPMPPMTPMTSIPTGSSPSTARFCTSWRWADDRLPPARRLVSRLARDGRGRGGRAVAASAGRRGRREPCRRLLRAGPRGGHPARHPPPGRPVAVPRTRGLPARSGPRRPAVRAGHRGCRASRAGRRGRAARGDRRARPGADHHRRPRPSGSSTRSPPSGSSAWSVSRTACSPG